MIIRSLYCAGTTSAAAFAAEYLRNAGVTIVREPGWDTGNLLLDVPSFQGNVLRGGGNPDTLLQSLPRDVTIWGGNLDHPALEGFRTVDLLKDEDYLARNAAITAHCALHLAAPKIKTTLAECPTLVIGWGRIGKCLGKLLASNGAPLVIAARKAQDRACLASLGYTAADLKELDDLLPSFRLVFNTVPAPVFSSTQMELCRNCVKIDLASCRGIAGEDVIHARGLPGIHAPESSGKLIAETILRLSKEV